MIGSADEAAFLASVASAPFDDAPKLIYADWLQEHDEEPKAEYLRTVVLLMHLPDDKVAVARCAELAKSLDSDWRQTVSGFFEVVLEGAGSFLLLALLFKTVLGLAFDEPIEFWQQGQPVRLRRSLTREDAETFVQKYGTPIANLVDDATVDKPLRLVIQPMTTEAPPELFAPT